MNMDLYLDRIQNEDEEMWNWLVDEPEGIVAPEEFGLSESI